MKKTFINLAISLMVLLGSLSFAQEIRIAFVNPNALLAAHPAGEAAAELVRQQEAELSSLISDIQALQSKSETAEGLTADERARANLLVRTLDEVRSRYEQDIRAASEPAVLAINAAVAVVAKANGFQLVLDGDLAGTAGLGLVVYADPEYSTDITDLVIAQMNAQ